ncbi:MAG TPA: MGMT family protein [Candidatus Dojkabacteria bacterium]|nr:MGMT family protein [Candidatus Dojkabacteria bacterium]HQF37345.1 MGMT family protein [Candidatus Dojkabacteria bacterium]
MKDWKENFNKTNQKGSVLKDTPRGKMYISTPDEIMSVIKEIPKGKIISTKDIAQQLAKKHKADYTCGLTIGIFVAIIANYVEQEKIKDVPYWRVVKGKGVLYESYLREPSKQEQYLKLEGHKIEKGKIVNARL